MQHQPFADEARRVRQAVGAATAHGHEKSGSADAVGADHDDRGGLEKFLPILEIDGAVCEPLFVERDARHARARHDARPVFHRLRNDGDVDRSLCALRAAKAADAVTNALRLMLVRARGNGGIAGPPVPTKLVQPFRHAFFAPSD